MRSAIANTATSSHCLCVYFFVVVILFIPFHNIVVVCVLILLIVVYMRAHWQQNKITKLIKPNVEAPHINDIMCSFSCLLLCLFFLLLLFISFRFIPSLSALLFVYVHVKNMELYRELKSKVESSLFARSFVYLVVFIRFNFETHRLHECAFTSLNSGLASDKKAWYRH